MFKIGQKVVRSHPVLSFNSQMEVGKIYTISWISPGGVSCHVEEVPETTWQTAKFAPLNGEEYEPVKIDPIKTIIYNRKPSVVSPAESAAIQV